MTINRSIQVLVLALLVVVACVTPSLWAQSSGADSPYVVRMMSLDRNGDGMLQANELPGKMAELLKQHDSNSDAALDRRELASIEAKAVNKRLPADAQSNSANAFGEGGGKMGDGMGRAGRSGGRAGGRRANAVGKSSPLDAEQILRFALTFDADKDGGLNSEELKRYAAALSLRRAAARQQRATEDGAAEEPVAPRQKEAPKGLGAPGSEAGKDPFGG